MKDIIPISDLHHMGIKMRDRKPSKRRQPHTEETRRKMRLAWEKRKGAYCEDI